MMVTVKRSRRRTVALSITPAGAITVYAPSFVWGPFIDRFVQKQKDWILKKLAYFKTLPPPPPPVNAEQRAVFTRQTEARLPEVVAQISSQLGVTPRRVRVAHQNSRWGSCTARGDIRFSWRMANLPDDAFEYIVAHELAHLRVLNHSQKFWEVVQSVVPDYKARRAALRAHARSRQ